MTRALLAICVVLACASAADARVVRFAVLVGNDRGDADEQNLRFAETDAARVRDVLGDLGGFAAEDLVLLQGRSAAEFRRALITVNDRIRSLPAGTDAVLLVYYSGHADADALHLGRSELPLDELEKLVRGSAAQVRLLIVDACRSGSLTRVKGGKAVAAFEIALAEQLASEGAVFLTSSAANEDAQESDELQGSFFTHYLVSGLLGAADDDGDAQVTVAEAYRHAYDSTLRASSRTEAGPQHPTFRYALAGRGDVVLTRLGAVAQRGQLVFPRGRGYLVLRGDANGPVLAEVGARDIRRAISLRAGRYFVRGRGGDHLVEGSVQLAERERRVVEDAQLRRIDYVRLVRKGGGALSRVWSVELGGSGHGVLPNADGPCLGGDVAISIDLRSFGAGVRGHWCRAAFDNATLAATIDEAGAELRAWRAFDLSWVTVVPAVALGGGVIHQRFETRGRAPARTSGLGTLGAELRLERAVSGPLYLYAGGGVATFAWPDGPARSASLTWRAALGIGARL